MSAHRETARVAAGVCVQTPLRPAAAAVRWGDAGSIRPGKYLPQVARPTFRCCALRSGTALSFDVGIYTDMLHAPCATSESLGCQRSSPETELNPLLPLPSSSSSSPSSSSSSSSPLRVPRMPARE